MKRKIVIIVLGLIIILISSKAIVWAKRKYELREQSPNVEMVKIAEKLVKVHVDPKFNYSYEFMKQGVIQHLDRQYTYEVIPSELLNGFLFQGIHRPPKGTSISFTLFAPANIYFFFHNKVDGGYSEIFKNLDNWELCNEAPQYEKNNGKQELNMVMYKLKAEIGTYSIPPTTKDKGCFNIVFQSQSGKDRF